MSKRVSKGGREGGRRGVKEEGREGGRECERAGKEKRYVPDLTKRKSTVKEK